MNPNVLVICSTLALIVVLLVALCAFIVVRTGETRGLRDLAVVLRALRRDRR